METKQNYGRLDAAIKLHLLGSKDVLITGHVIGDQIFDYWSDGKQLYSLPNPVIATKNIHGSGDTLSAAICALLAQGKSTGEAIRLARKYTAGALQSAVEWKLGQGHGPLSHFVEQ